MKSTKYDKKEKKPHTSKYRKRFHLSKKPMEDPPVSPTTRTDTSNSHAFLNQAENMNNTIDVEAHPEHEKDEVETPQMNIWVTFGLLGVVTIVSHLIILRVAPAYSDT